MSTGRVSIDDSEQYQTFRKLRGDNQYFIHAFLCGNSCPDLLPVQQLSRGMSTLDIAFNGLGISSFVVEQSNAGQRKMDLVLENWATCRARLGKGTRLG